MNQLILTAKKMALKHHSTLCRPNASEEPIILHLAEVAGMVADYTRDSNVICSAWLHDAVEDTEITLEDIEKTINAETMELVRWLTDPPHWKNLPLTERKRLQAERIRKAPQGAKLVKLADQISNIRSVRFDPPMDWQAQKRQAYIEGALLVGQACSGSYDILDDVLHWHKINAQ